MAPGGHTPIMNDTLYGLLRWAPRLLGIGVAIFLSLFALDAFGQGRPWREATADFVIHLTPAALILAAVVASWRREWIGAVAFVGFAIGYASLALNRPDWILAISGPLFLVGILFLASWWLSAFRYRAG